MHLIVTDLFLAMQEPFFFSAITNVYPHAARTTVPSSPETSCVKESEIH